MKARRKPPNERRKKLRIPMQRELRYKQLDDCRIIAQGRGETLNIGSGGIAFRTSDALPVGCYVEMSVSWPVLLDDRCRMQLVVIGRIIRGAADMRVCAVEKWEFRTQAREVREVTPIRVDGGLLRWAEYRRDVAAKTVVAASA